MQMNGIGWQFELKGGSSWKKVVSRVVFSQTLYSSVTTCSYQLRSGNGRGGSGTVGTDIDIIA